MLSGEIKKKSFYLSGLDFTSFLTVIWQREVRHKPQSRTPAEPENPEPGGSPGFLVWVCLLGLLFAALGARRRTYFNEWQGFRPKCFPRKATFHEVFSHLSTLQSEAFLSSMGQGAPGRGGTAHPRSTHPTKRGLEVIRPSPPESLRNLEAGGAV